jgi:hypothetical protein
MSWMVDTIANLCLPRENRYVRSGGNDRIYAVLVMVAVSCPQEMTERRKVVASKCQPILGQYLPRTAQDVAYSWVAALD